MSNKSESHGVSNPSHYNQGIIECIDAIAAALSPEELSGFIKGNVIKYLWRANHKGNSIQDVEKAAWYLEWWLSQIKQEKI